MSDPRFSISTAQVPVSSDEAVYKSELRGFLASIMLCPKYRSPEFRRPALCMMTRSDGGDLPALTMLDEELNSNCSGPDFRLALYGITVRFDDLAFRPSSELIEVSSASALIPEH